MKKLKLFFMESRMELYRDKMGKIFRESFHQYYRKKVSRDKNLTFGKNVYDVKYYISDI